MYKWKKLKKEEYEKNLGNFVYLSNLSSIEFYSVEEALEKGKVTFAVLNKISHNKDFVFDSAENKFTEIYEKVFTRN